MWTTARYVWTRSSSLRGHDTLSNDVGEHIHESVLPGFWSLYLLARRRRIQTSLHDHVRFDHALSHLCETSRRSAMEQTHDLCLAGGRGGGLRRDFRSSANRGHTDRTTTISRRNVKQEHLLPNVLHSTKLYRTLFLA